MITGGLVSKPRNFALRMAAERKAGKPIPKSIVLEVTYRCNLHCIHCGLTPQLNKNTQAELTFSEVTRLLDQIFSFGIMSVTFTGGETLCRPDILDIMDYATERGLFWGFKTNGTLLTEAIAGRLTRAGITSVHVSLYGATEETHERITRVHGSFKKTINGIRILKNYDIPVAVHNSVMKYNCQEVAKLRELTKQLGVMYRIDPTIFPMLGEPGSADCIRMDDQQLLQFLRASIFKDNKVDLDNIGKTDLEKHLLCSAARTHYAVSPEGDVYPCAVWRQPLGNLKQQSFSDIWHGDAARMIREIKVDDLSGCKNCELLRYCSRCPGLVYLENSDISGPSPESCRLARAIKGVISDDH